MVRTCLVFGCGSRSNRDRVSFFSVPTELNHRFLTLKNDLSRKRRAAWIAALKRKDLTASKLAHQKICSRHFITGKPALLENEHQPDWIPSQYMGHDGNVFSKKGKTDTSDLSLVKMEVDLLLKEDEFHKENEKLELHQKELLMKVNDVMKIQDNLIKDSFKTQTQLNEVIKGNKFPKKPIIEQPLPLLDDGRNDERISSDNTERILRVYKGKFISSEAEKEKLQNELRQKYEEIKKLQKETQRLKEEREKWFLSYNCGKNTIGKLESQVVNVNAKLQSKDAENACLKKELEHLKKELKNGNLNFNNCEVRLTRACEENEKLRASLKQSKEEEKDLKDGYRKQLNELTTTVKHLEKQKIELLNGFKKQTQLIDVLKKQKVHVEALKLGEMTETEYSKILDWNFDN